MVAVKDVALQLKRKIKNSGSSAEVHLKKTQYADRLDKDLDEVNFLDKIKTQQRNWIGNSSGVNLKFKVKDLDMHFEMYDSIPQTFMAQTFTIIAPDHPKLFDLVKGTPYEQLVIQKSREMISKRLSGVYEKTGEMDGIFTGRYIEYTPARRQLPIWVSSYALADYGTGVVNCSYHDERDYAFAKKFNIPLHPVLFPKDELKAKQIQNQEIFYREPDGILEEPFEFKGRRWDESREDIINHLVENGWGKRATNYKLRDWVFSRQHYWGEPIPVVFCDNCKNKKYNVVLLHGFNSKFADNFRPWLKGELERMGHTVVGLDLPNPSRPLIDEQVDYILKNVNIDENTILVGHSLGGVVILRLLERIKNKIYKAIIVDSPLKPKFNDKERLPLLNAYDWKFDFKKIKKNSENFVVLADSEYHTVPKDQLDEMAKNLDAKYITSKPVAPHFKGKEEPEILKVFEDEGVIPLPENSLPVKLPDVEKYQPTDDGESPLSAITKWVEVKCPCCGGRARRETDTMPNWAGSSWYYLRYMDPKNSKVFADSKKLAYWNMVDWYNGGMEHTTLHLLYSRFWHKFLFDIGVVPTKEPYNKRTSHGLILAEGGVKMSKSKGNVINPDDLIKNLGADALRVYEMFMGPFDQAIAWNTDGIVGTRRFIEKVWRIGQKVAEFKGVLPKEENKELETLIHKTVKKVGEDIENMRFNTAISALMICANDMDSSGFVSKKNFEMFLMVLSPFAPHVSEELWAMLKNKGLISNADWPNYDDKKTINENVIIVVQVNGKIRAQFLASNEIEEKEALLKAKELPEIQTWISGKVIKKEIYVKGKLVSLVV
jgi:leucyl-tRNA synthetase/predicted alpha/beta hydrolase family esterase